ncbi:hypothetical protein BDR26DRAFT_788415, partial [Obelidium mucronatum]
VGGKSVVTRITDVLYIPNAPTSLLSGSRLDDAGHRVTIENGSATIINKAGRVVGVAKRTGGGSMYMLDCDFSTDVEEEYMLAAMETDIW